MEFGKYITGLLEGRETYEVSFSIHRSPDAVRIRVIDTETKMAGTAMVDKEDAALSGIDLVRDELERLILWVDARRKETGCTR